MASFQMQHFVTFCWCAVILFSFSSILWLVRIRLSDARSAVCCKQTNQPAVRMAQVEKLEYQISQRRPFQQGGWTDERMMMDRGTDISVLIREISGRFSFRSSSAGKQSFQVKAEYFVDLNVVALRLHSSRFWLWFEVLGLVRPSCCPQH